MPSAFAMHLSGLLPDSPEIIKVPEVISALLGLKDSETDLLPQKV